MILETNARNVPRSTQKKCKIMRNCNHGEELIYETETASGSPSVQLQQQLERLNSNSNLIQARIFGQGSNFDGFGSKFAAVQPLLEELHLQAQEELQSTAAENVDPLVVLSDGRDVLINHVAPDTAAAHAQQLVHHFVESYHRLMANNAPDAVVFSADHVQSQSIGRQHTIGTIHFKHSPCKLSSCAKSEREVGRMSGY